jgi:GR25 family glycosyltransferase involved in LPS biosynthesis
MKIFVISLVRSAERRASVTRQFAVAGLAFEFINGVNGPSNIRNVARAHARSSTKKRLDCYLGSLFATIKYFTSA